MAGLPVVFFSDAHLGAESKAREAGREARLHSFLKSLGGRISRLIIVGDLFDFWLGPFLSDDLGIRTHHGAMTLEHDGRRIWIHHGDALVGGDHGYRLLKRVLRHPASIALYRLIHPDFGIPLARWVSSGSRHAQGQRPLEADRLWSEVALPRFAEGFDAVVLGHFHHAYERREGGRELFVLGDWIQHFTYLTLADGRMQMDVWSG